MHFGCSLTTGQGIAGGAAVLGLLLVGCASKTPPTTGRPDSIDSAAPPAASSTSARSTAPEGTAEAVLPATGGSAVPEEDPDSLAKLEAVFGDGSAPVGPTATVTFAEPTGPATLATKLIARYVIASEAKLLTCYEHEVRGAQPLSVTFSVSVSATGLATEVSATGVSTAAATCMVDVIKGTTFPDGKSGDIGLVATFDSRIGRGGGGTGLNSIGIGSYAVPGSVDPKPSYGMLGRGSSSGNDYGEGSGLGRQKVRIPSARVGKATVSGTGLDRAVIKRYIMRARTKITYCYEKELARNPKLAGVVTTKFVIGADGFVSVSTATGVDVEVSRCVASVIKAIQFPKPSGAGSVTVGYPFTFVPPSM